MGTKKIIVVIVTFNAMKWVNKCFSSIKKSSMPVKSIVIDNGSNDGTQKEIQTNFPEVQIHQSPFNKGFGQANNIGIKLAIEEGADYVFLLNQDTWVEPETISTLFSQHENNPEFGILSPIQLNGEGSAIDPYFNNYISHGGCPNLISDIYLNKINNNPYPTTMVNAAAWFMSKGCIEKVGGFSPSFFHYGEDDNYLNRLHYYQLKIGVVPSAIIYHDREPRSNNSYFKNQKAINQRLLMVEYSNPILNKNIFKGKLSFLKSSLFSLVKLNLDMSKKMWGNFKFLLDKGVIIEKNRKESMEGKKQCFLT